MTCYEILRPKTPPHICIFAVLPWVDKSDFPQSQSAQLQRLSTEEDEQPLSVHLWANKSWNFSILKTTTPLRITEHVWLMITSASRKAYMYLDVITISRCQGDDTFVAFQAMGIFRFWRNGKFLFSKDVYSQPLYFSQFPIPSQLNLLFCAGVQFSRDYIRAFNDWMIKIRENRGLWTV